MSNHKCLVKRPGKAWTKELVIHMLLNTCSTRFYYASPYFGELYRHDLADRIQHPSEVGDHHCAAPLGVLVNGKSYFIPGSVDDLILHTSCVAACVEPIVRSLPTEQQEDLGPPSFAELSQGFCGDQSSLRAAWTKLNTLVQQRLGGEGGIIVAADVASCIATIDLDRLHKLLQESGADHAAVQHLWKMHLFWCRTGCHGLPLTGSFRLLIKLYLAKVDDRLRREGIIFVRIQDDFRLFCRNKDEAKQACHVLEEALATCKMRINHKKTVLLQAGRFMSWSLHRQELVRLFSGGVGVPLLTEMLQLDALRPIALLLIRQRYGHHCWPMPTTTSTL